MSHTTSIGTIQIRNIEAVRRAVAELQSKGIRCELVENATPRAYYTNQDGMGRADYVVKLPTAAYDIGLYKKADGQYEARTDFFGGSVEKLLGVKGGTAQDKLGQFFQHYAVNAAEIEAQNNGYQTQRSWREDGSVQLMVMGF